MAKEAWKRGLLVASSASVCFSSSCLLLRIKINFASGHHNYADAYENVLRTYVVLNLPRVHLQQVKRLQYTRNFQAQPQGFRLLVRRPLNST